MAGASIFPASRFTAADTVAAYGLQGALLIGPRRRVAPADRERWLADAAQPALEVGEIVTTGAFTRALPGAPGQE
jgi:2-oxo-3-hexenedioate decarboxylase